MLRGLSILSQLPRDSLREGGRALRQYLSILSQLPPAQLARCWRFGRGDLSILSQLPRDKSVAERTWARPYFQFFPSCLAGGMAVGVKAVNPSFQFFPSCLMQQFLAMFHTLALSILSQLPLVWSCALYPVRSAVTFQFFPSCLRTLKELVRIRDEVLDFQFFPSCLEANWQLINDTLSLLFQFFPSCLLGGFSARASLSSCRCLSILSQLPQDSDQLLLRLLLGDLSFALSILSQLPQTEEPGVPGGLPRGLSILSQLPPM